MGALIRMQTLRFFHAPDVPVPLAIPAPADFMLIRDADAFPWTGTPRPEHHDTYRARFARGHSALTGVVDGAQAFVAWIACTALDVDEIRFRWMLSAGERCVYDVVTEAAFRGRGVYPAALSWFARQHAAGAEPGRVWIYCDASNSASRNGIGRAGWVYAGSVRSLWVRNTMLARVGHPPAGKR